MADRDKTPYSVDAVADRVLAGVIGRTRNAFAPGGVVASTTSSSKHRAGTTTVIFLCLFMMLARIVARWVGPLLLVSLECQKRRQLYYDTAMVVAVVIFGFVKRKI
jgi:hypothetical protein